MATTAATEFHEQLTEFSRMRTFLWFYIASAVIFVSLIFEEFGADMHEIDDVFFVLFALVGIFLIASKWKKRALQEIKKTNSILATIAVLMIVVSVYAMFVEAAAPMDLGDDFPQLILSVLILLSRYIY